jgi:hypothetical protein
MTTSSVANSSPTVNPNPLRSVGTGTINIGTKEFEVDVLSDGSRTLRLKRVSEAFGASAKTRDSARHLERIAGNSQANEVQPRVYALAHGLARGITSDQFTKLLTVYIDRALEGKLHPKQMAALPTVRAIEKALIATAIDELIDAACGVQRTAEKTQERATQHVVTQLRTANDVDVPSIYEARKKVVLEELERTTAFVLGLFPNTDREVIKGRIMQFALGQADTGGTGREFGYWPENVFLDIRASVVGFRSIAQGFATVLAAPKKRLPKPAPAEQRTLTISAENGALRVTTTVETIGSAQ